MGRRRKLRGRELISLIPLLQDLCRSKHGGRRKKILRNMSEGQKENTCRLVELALKHVPEKHFSPSELKSLYVRGEQLKFLRDIGKCCRKKREGLREKRDKTLLQTGGSLSLILGVIVPIVADLVYSKLIKPALERKKNNKKKKKK